MSDGLWCLFYRDTKEGIDEWTMNRFRNKPDKIGPILKKFLLISIDKYLNNMQKFITNFWIFIYFSSQKTKNLVKFIWCYFASNSCSWAVSLPSPDANSTFRVAENETIFYRIHQMILQLFCNYESKKFSRNWVCLFILMFCKCK